MHVRTYVCMYIYVCMYVYVATVIIIIHTYVYIRIYIYFVVQSDDSLQVIIKSDPPINNNTPCVNETVLLTCQVSDAIQPTYKWFTRKLIISNISSIKIIATDDPTQYYCRGFDVANKRSGESNITIYGKGSYF